MSNSAGSQKPNKKGTQSYFKLDIPSFRDKNKKKRSATDKEAAAFLSAQHGDITKALDCRPESGVAVVTDKDEPVLQVQLLSGQNGGEDDPGILPAEPEPNLTKLYKTCFEAKESYEKTLQAFLDYETKTSVATSAGSTAPVPLLPVSGPGMSEQTFEQVEEDIKRVEEEIGKAVKHVHGVSDRKKQRQEQQWLVARGLRKVFQKFASNARNIGSYVSLLPKSAGFGLGGLICGGISILLKAAERHMLMDKHMEHALKGIKEVLVHKAYKFYNHEPDSQMHRLISALFASIFVVLESLVMWLYQQATGKAIFGALLQPDTYGQDLAMRIADMERKSVTVEKYGQRLERTELQMKVDALKEVADKTHGVVKKVLQRHSKELKLLEGLGGGQDDLKNEVRDMGKSVQQAVAQNSEVQATLSGIQRQMDQLEKLQRANAVWTCFALISEDPPQQASGVPLLPASQTAMATLRSLRDSRGLPPRNSNRNRNRNRNPVLAKPSIDAETVLRSVGFQRDLTASDIRGIMRGARLDQHDEKIASEMTRHVRLQAFMESPSNYVLLVEGGVGGRHVTRGPVSLVTTRVVSALGRVRETNASLYALAYFCSEHQSATRPFGSAQDLVITLLLQLIEQHEEFDTALLQDCQDAVANSSRQPSTQDIRGFCDLLERCVRALPVEATLFCVVEGLAFFERPNERTAQTCIIVERLLELGRDDVDGCARVKCLFTTPTRSPVFTGHFEPYEVLTLQIVNSAGSSRTNSWMKGRIGF